MATGESGGISGGGSGGGVISKVEGERFRKTGIGRVVGVVSYQVRYVSGVSIEGLLGQSPYKQGDLVGGGPNIVTILWKYHMVPCTDGRNDPETIEIVARR